MMDFTGNSYQNLLRSMLDRVPDTYDKREGSFFQMALGPAAYALEEFYIGLSQVQEMAFIQTAVGKALDYLTVIGGIRRKQATPAVRLGEFNAPVPLGARFSTVGDGLNFTVTGASGQPGQYLLTAETPGSVGNQYSGALLPITFIEGLSSARLTDILVPGDDTETDEDLRQRLIAAMTDRPFGGNIAAYRESILEVDGVGQVQVYPTWDGGGTVKCSILGSDSIDPLGLSYSARDPRPGDSITVSVEAASPAFGGEISYQYAYRVNGGSWVNLGNKTTSASKTFTVPANAESIQVRVLAADGWGFTSADYVQGPVLSVVKMAAYAGVSDKARAMGKLYVGVNGKAREITAAYVGVGGKARKIL